MAAPSPILRPAPFLFALGSPFGLTLSAALSPPRGSLGERRGDLLTLPRRFGCMIPRAPLPVKRKFQRVKAKGAERDRLRAPGAPGSFTHLTPFPRGGKLSKHKRTRRCGGMVDTRDLKSLAGNCVPVRVGSPAPRRSSLRTARKRQTRKRLPFTHLCSVAPPSQIEPTPLGFDLVLGVTRI